MASLVRRIQRMPKRTSKGASKRMFGLHIGDRLGVHNKDAADLVAREKREQLRLVDEVLNEIIEEEKKSDQD